MEQEKELDFQSNMMITAMVHIFRIPIICNHLPSSLGEQHCFCDSIQPQLTLAKTFALLSLQVIYLVP